MGNRAVVLPKGSTVGVYLHWNGGPDSVEAFLEYCKLRRFRSFGGENRDGYGMARFVQVVANFFGGTLSIGIEENCEETEEWAEYIDNGVYVVDGWDVVKRIGATDYREGYDRKEMLLSIDESQPTEEQLGEEFFDSEPTPIGSIKVGDEVYIDRLEEIKEKHKVVGIAPANTTVNGVNVSFTPYIDLYDRNGDYSWNINNYVTRYAENGMIRRVKK